LPGTPISCHPQSRYQGTALVVNVVSRAETTRYAGEKFNAVALSKMFDCFLTVITLQALMGSSVLSHVNEGLLRRFIAILTAEWLPSCRVELLYRGSRDGMTPEAFHEKCDDKGPTLVLVAGQSVGQPVCVFGGYASNSWELGAVSMVEESVEVSARDSFVFTVLNPFGDGIVKMPLRRAESAANVLICRHNYGPWFLNGFVVRNSSAFPAVAFEKSSYCDLRPDGPFVDPTNRGMIALTGAKNFTPLDVEVWSVGW
jgi:TLD